MNTYNYAPRGGKGASKRVCQRFDCFLFRKSFEGKKNKKRTRGGTSLVAQLAIVGEKCQNRTQIQEGACNRKF